MAMGSTWASRPVRAGVTLCLCVAAPALAQVAGAVSPVAPECPPSEPEPAREHDKTRAEQIHTGAFLRFHLGYANMSANFSPYRVTGGSNFGFALGGTLVRGFALAGLLDFAADGSDESIFVGQLALTVSYYFLPVNSYAAISIGSASGGYEDLAVSNADERPVETEGALSYTASFGHEFLFEHGAWGLGPALRLWYANFDDGRFIATALVLSATHH